MSQQPQPAFPCDWKDFQPGTGQQVAREQFFGLTKREYFASRAMQAMYGSESWPSDDDATEIARRSVVAADALIEALNHMKP